MSTLTDTIQSTQNTNLALQIHHAYFPYYLQLGEIEKLLSETKQLMDCYSSEKHMDMARNFGHDCLLCAHSHRSFAALTIGDYDEVLSCVSQSFETGLSNIYPTTKTFVGMAIIPMAAYIGQKTLLNKHAKKVIELCEKQNHLINLSGALSAKAFFFAEKKDYEAAATTLEGTIETLLSRHKMRQNTSIIIMQLLYYLLHANRVEEVQSVVETWSSEILDQQFDIIFSAHHKTWEAIVLYHRSNVDETIVHKKLDEAIEKARNNRWIDGLVFALVTKYQLLDKSISEQKVSGDTAKQQLADIVSQLKDVWDKHVQCKKHADSINLPHVVAAMALVKNG